MTQVELTPEELDALLESQAEQRQREERKLLLLYRLEGIPADDPRWEKIAHLLEE